MSNHAVITILPGQKIEQLVKEILNYPQKQLLLEVPENVSLLNNEVNLRLIKFYAEDEEKELIIHAVDPLLIALAQRLGISTIRERDLGSETALEEEAATLVNPPAEAEEPAIKSLETNPPAVRTRVRKRYRWCGPRQSFIPALGMTIFTLALAIWWFMQPRVTLIVYPKEQLLNFGARAMISPRFRERDIPVGKIPVLLKKHIGELTIRTRTSGSKTIGVTPASGKVILINNFSKPLVVPKGTKIFARGNLLFLTMNEVVVPPKITKRRFGIKIGEEYGKVQVGIIASQKGSITNQPIQSVQGIEAKFQKYLQVVNTEPMTGGKDQRIQVVTTADILKGELEGEKEARLIARNDMVAKAGTDSLFLPELLGVRILVNRSNPPASSEADTVMTHVKYQSQILLPTRALIHKYLESQFIKHIPPNFKWDHRTLELTGAQVISSDSELAELHLGGSGKVHGILSPSKIRSLVEGKSIAEADAALSREEEIASYRIKMIEPDRRQLPRFGFQIRLIFPNRRSK